MESTFRFALTKKEAILYSKFEKKHGIGSGDD